MNQENPLTRRDFLKANAGILALAGSGLLPMGESPAAAEAPASAVGQKNTAAKATKAPWYQKTYRRILIDTHIPDWDQAFLSKYDPAEMAKNYDRAAVSAVMLYFQSLVGLCNWPTKSGQMHRGLIGRDILGEMVGELKKRAIPVTAYYAVTFNDWAYMEHPDWRIVSLVPSPIGRAAFCCPNNPGYKAFVMTQLEEFVPRYDIDGVFFDFTLWPSLCVCPTCRERYRREGGGEFPATVDWTNPQWCTFQATRERWITEFARDLTTKVKSLKPALTVEHNFAQALNAWNYAVPLESASCSDFLGGDFFGDPIEQLTHAKILLNLTENKPAEFMTSVCVSVGDHVGLKRREQLQTSAFAATLLSSAFLFIDGIDPVGTVNPGKYELIGEIYRATQPYEPFLGGEPVEDIAIYFSGSSHMDFAENGTPIEKCSPGYGYGYPHMLATRGACRLLQEAHLPFGIITRKQLGSLDRYKLVILPNVLRMDQEEAEAFRAYVKRGGNIYASRCTSLTETKGVRHPDFMMADMFGCHYDGEAGGVMAYFKPCEEFVRSAIAPQDYAGLHSLLLKEKIEGRALARLTLPYSYPSSGGFPWWKFDYNFASMWSSPPWEDTPRPTIVFNQYGKGKSIYSAAVLEDRSEAATQSLFLALVEQLTGGTEDLSWSAKTHPAVWMSVFDQPERHQMTVSFLNNQPQWPALPIQRTPFTLRPPKGRKVVGIYEAPGGPKVKFTVDRRGTVHAEARDLHVFKMLVVEYKPASL